MPHSPIARDQLYSTARALRHLEKQLVPLFEQALTLAANDYVALELQKFLLEEVNGKTRLAWLNESLYDCARQTENRIAQVRAIEVVHKRAAGEYRRPPEPRDPTGFDNALDAARELRTSETRAADSIPEPTPYTPEKGPAIDGAPPCDSLTLTPRVEPKSEQRDSDCPPLSQVRDESY